MTQVHETAMTDKLAAYTPDDLPTDPQVADLDLTDAELDGIKGGPSLIPDPTPKPYSEDGGGGIGGDWVINHNETVVSDK